jgi:hypothetical protein
MRITQKSCEIAISKEDLHVALRLWVKRVTMCGSDDFRIVKITQHPDNKYVVRMTIEPPEKVAEIKAAKAPQSDDRTDASGSTPSREPNPLPPSKTEAGDG